MRSKTSTQADHWIMGWYRFIHKRYAHLAIRSRMAIQFTLLVAVILSSVFISVFTAFSVYRRHYFTLQLRERAILAAEAYLSEDNVPKEKFQDIQGQFQKAPADEMIAVFDRFNRPVFVQNNLVVWPRSSIDQIRRQKELSFPIGLRECYGIYYHDNQGDYVIISSALDTKGRRLIRFLGYTMGIIFLLSLVGVYFLGHIFGKNALSPISNMIHQVSKMEASNLHLRVLEGDRKDEIGELAQTFNHLLSRLEKSFEVQKTFVAGASHELRTPITALIGEVEVSLSKSRRAGDYQKTLENILLQAEKLHEITSSLFHLTYQEGDCTGLDPLRLDQLLYDAIELYQTPDPRNRLEIILTNLPEHSSDLVLVGDKQLLMIAFGNILSNALKFSGNNPVLCRFIHEKAHNRIFIEDRGIGIDQDDMQRILSPFFRGKNAHPFPGAGIGLSLAERIIRFYDGSLTVHSTPGQGTEVEISFPIATKPLIT